MTRRTKIVCTLGPATASDERLKELVESGMDVARMNFSHGTHEDHAAVYARVRKASDTTEKAVGVLADLQGPKIRLGRFDGCDGSTVWETGEQVRITVDVRRDDHRALKRTAEDMADELGVSRVPIQQVMAALAHQVTTDQQLRDAVTTYLRDSGTQ